MSMELGTFGEILPTSPRKPERLASLAFGPPASRSWPVSTPISRMRQLITGFRLGFLSLLEPRADETHGYGLLTNPASKT
jgi:hypothetical protein